MKYDPTKIREILLDKAASQEFIDEAIDSRFSAEAIKNRFWDAWDISDFPEDEVMNLSSSLLRMFAQKNLQIIHQYSESPIEKIFLGALNFGVVALCTEYFMHPFINFVDPAPSASKAIRENREYWTELNEARRAFAKASRNDDPIDFIDFAIENGQMHQEDRAIAIAQIIIYQDMGNTYQLMPQAKFPEIIISGRSIRTDMLVWKPTDSRFNLVLECDGYEYHSSRESFSNDRARDRMLKSKGYDVLRFSGTEIHHRPVHVAAEVVRYLYQYKANTPSNEIE